MNLAEQLEEQKQKAGEVINFPNIKLKKNGMPKKIKNNSIKGNPHEVYPIKEEQDRENMKHYFKNKTDTATNEEDKFIFGRDELAFKLGLNIGLRASDMLKFTWDDIFYADGSFCDGSRIQEQKTKKYKNLYLNKNAQEAINYYISEFNIKVNPTDYIFTSRKGGHIETDTLSTKIKEAAKACGIQYNVGSHSLRKTWAYTQIKAHPDDIHFLAHLMKLLNHSSMSATLHYAGLEDELNKQYYNDVNN